MVRGLSVPEMLHEDMIAEFNTYALVGGMPEAVAEYLDAGDITRLAPIFNALLKGYNEDAEKFAKNQEQAKILRHILSTAWLSAAETITFGCFGNSSYTATQIHDAMDLLERAYLLSLDYPVPATAVPAMPAKRRAPQLMMVDTGLAFRCNICKTRNCWTRGAAGRQNTSWRRSCASQPTGNIKNPYTFGCATKKARQQKWISFGRTAYRSSPLK